MKDTWNNNDHDTLIEIRTLVSDLRLEIKELKDGTHLQLVDHERRIRDIEDMTLRIQPDQRIQKYDKLADDWNEFRTRLKVYIALASFFAGLIATLFTTLLRVYLGQ